MKPQFLQDAIKTAALKKTQKRDNGGWKDPHVKQHKMSAEEYTQLKSSAPARSASAAVSTPVATGGITMAQVQGVVQQALQEQKQAWAKERNELLAQMKELRTKQQDTRVAAPSQTNNHSSKEEIAELRREIQSVSHLVSTVKTQGKEIEMLQKEIKKATTTMPHTTTATTSTGNDSKLSAMLETQVSEIQRLRNELTELRKELKQTKISAATHCALGSATSNQAITAAKPTITKSKSQSKLQQAGAPKTPVKRSKSNPRMPGSTKSPKCTAISLDEPKSPGSKAPLPTLKPRFVSVVADAQKKDKALKEFLKSKGTSGSLPAEYTFKTMRIHDLMDSAGETRHLVCFQYNRVYVPEKIRSGAMEHYYKTNPYGCTAALQQHCIWPDCESDMKAYKLEQRQAV